MAYSYKTKFLINGINIRYSAMLLKMITTSKAFTCKS